MRFPGLAICATASAALLAGCSGNLSSGTPSTPSVTGATQSYFSNGRYMPVWSKSASLIPASLRPTGRMPLHGQSGPLVQKTGSSSTGGIYVSEFYGTQIYGYPHNNMSNGAPTCTILLGTQTEPQGIAADNAGNLIVPEGYPNLSAQVHVYAGPNLCGPEIGSFQDTYGQPEDASSTNASNGKIAVGNMFDTNGAGSISICTIAGGCTANLTNSNMYEVAGVLMDKAGDCWASAATQSGTATLTYFKHCSGNGQAATGFQNKYYGGLDIDKDKNIVAISSFDAKLYVYKGCKPACTQVGGPYSLQGQTMFGHLNKQSMIFAAADYQYGQIDVYQYSTSGITYIYSFNNGLNATDMVEGVAESPRSER
jgi:hypothetical protein